MTNQQAPEIYTLHTVPNKGERPWSGIYTVRADAEHDAKVMREVTGRHWSVVRLVVADTATTPTGPITRYEVVDCIDSKHVPAVIPNGAGPWVRYEDHAAALCRLHAENEALRTQQPAPAAINLNCKSEQKRLATLWGFVPAPATQQAGWTNADADAARLALELECLLMDTKDAAVVSKWWASANDALEMHRARLQEVQPTPTAQAAESVLEDAERLDWLALAGPTSICLVIDRPHDGEVEVATDDVTGYGKTLREAIDAAMNKGGA